MSRVLQKIALSVFALGSFAPAAIAATTDTPLAHAEIQKYGQPYPGMQYLELRKVYEPYLRDAGFERPIVTRDIAFGNHELQKLDVLEPASRPAAPMPIVMFVHGGAFVRGDKGGREIFDNVLAYFTRHGMLGVNVNYRLAPAHGYPAATDDIGAALRWVRANAERYGGDPERIFLLGHSAGAVHVASYLLTESLQIDDGKDGVAGGMLMSGVYGATPDDEPGHVYFGDDPALVAARQPIAHLDGRKVPLFVVDAEYDPLRMQREAQELVEAICKRDGECPRYQRVAGHNHYSLMYHINTRDDSIASSLVEFVRQVAGAADTTRSAAVFRSGTGQPRLMEFSVP